MAIRGFAPWNPTEESRAILAAVGQIIEEYEAQLPLTGRQLFYVLVGQYGYEKSERAANKLYGVLGRARRAGMLAFDAIRDGGGTSRLPRTWADAADFWHEVRDDWKHFSRDRQRGQPVYCELFCESPGMIPQLVRQAFPYSVPVYGTRGFAGLDVVRMIAKRALERDVPTVLLQVGDYDPSGESIFESMAMDAAEFVRQVTWSIEEQREGTGDLIEALGIDFERMEELEALRDRGDELPDIRPVRVALTREQVARYELPTAPASRKDSRSKGWVGETCQAEALPPDLLAQIVRDAIRAQLDHAVLGEELELEKQDKVSIAERMPESETPEQVEGDEQDVDE